MDSDTLDGDDQQVVPWPNHPITVGGTVYCMSASNNTELASLKPVTIL